MGKGKYFEQMTLEQVNIHIFKKVNFDPYLTPYTNLSQDGFQT